MERGGGNVALLLCEDNVGIAIYTVAQGWERVD